MVAEAGVSSSRRGSNIGSRDSAVVKLVSSCCDHIPSHNRLTGSLSHLLPLPLFHTASLTPCHRFIWLTGWSVWTETRMTRSPDRPDTSPTLGELLKEKAEQGVNVSEQGTHSRGGEEG
jgi:hypothetical protein